MVHDIHACIRVRPTRVGVVQVVGVQAHLSRSLRSDEWGTSADRHGRRLCQILHFVRPLVSNYLGHMQHHQHWMLSPSQNSIFLVYATTLAVVFVGPSKNSLSAPALASTIISFIFV